MEAFGEESSTYTTEQAVEDGRLISLGETGFVPVYASKNCYFRAGLDNPLRCRRVVAKALEALRKPFPGDTISQKLRITKEEFCVESNGLWVILNDQGLTIMFPEDY